MAEAKSIGSEAPTRQTSARQNTATVAKLEALPDQVRALESTLIAARRSATFGGEHASDTPPHHIGVAVSGGGIRSATFALGFFQTLARTKLLRHVDYLSTVSGGGYFGSFLGALFSRSDSMAKLASTPAREDSEKDAQTPVEKILSDPNHPSLRYLRENGRYLAPSGSSDLMLGATVLFRNWLAVQVVLLSILFFGFLFAESSSLFVLSSYDGFNSLSLELLEDLLIKRSIWISPWVWLPLMLAILVALPLGWSYWTIERRLPLRYLPSNGPLRRLCEVLWLILPHLAVAMAGAALILEAPLFGGVCIWVAVLGLSTALVTSGRRTNGSSLWYPYLFGALVVVAHGLLGLFEVGAHVEGWQIALVVGLLAVLSAAATPRSARGSDETSEPAASTTPDSFARHRVSEALKSVLLICGALLAFALVDTLGRSLYAAYAGNWDVVLGVSGGLGALLFAIAGFARKIAVLSSSGADGKRPSLPVGVLAWGGAIALVLVVLTGVSFATQAITWDGDTPRRGPGCVTVSIRDPDSSCDLSRRSMTLIEPRGVGSPWVDLVLKVPVPVESENVPATAGGAGSEGTTEKEAEPNDSEHEDPPSEQTDELTPSDASWRSLWGALVALSVSLLLGSSRLFLNRSTHLPLYSARLTRAYLGASNRKRLDPEVAAEFESDAEPAPDAATRVIPGDDIAADDYWGWREPVPFAPNDKSAQQQVETKAPWKNGGPLHLVNVTINETVDGRSRIQQGDRKGLGLAIGPVTLSAGVRHHWLMRDGVTENTAEKPAAENEVAAAEQKHAHRVFAFKEKSHDQYPLERLSIGQWMAISGAAFSTGLGSRTNVGMSLIAGFTNIRLGYWWRPGVERVKRWWSVPYLLGVVFWVQGYLFRELLARFPGTANQLWYLSDGGHFENMGGYELIRRRLPFILILDAEADAKVQFEGLGNLVRKARLDFDAELQFVDPKQTPLARDSKLPIGSLDDLRPYEKGDPRLSDEAIQHPKIGRARACAALAKIRYADDPNTSAGSPQLPKEGWLLYVKPTLIEGLPMDLEHYASQRTSFPHESTGDQFFDEAQWESYRKLGELIGELLFPSGDAALADFMRGQPAKP